MCCECCSWRGLANHHLTTRFTCPTSCGPCGTLSSFLNASTSSWRMGATMAYFVSNSGNHYVSLFFSRKNVNQCSGTLFALSGGGTRLTLLLPVLAALISVATVAEIFTWIAYFFSPPQETGSMLTSINWVAIWASIFSVVVGAAVISFSQFHAIKHKDFFHGGENCKLCIDWVRSVAAFSINILFSLNGILFSLWAEFAASESDAGEATNDLAPMLLGLVALLVPGTVRLIWLFKVRGFSDVSWGGDSKISRPM